MSSFISFTSLIKDESLVKFIEEDKPVRSTCLTFSTTTTTLITTSSLTDSRVKASHLWRPRLALRIPSSSSHLDRPRRSYRPGTRLPAAAAYDLGNGGMTGAELGTDADRVRRGYLGWGNNWEGSDAGSSASDDTTSSSTDSTASTSSTTSERCIAFFGLCDRVKYPSGRPSVEDSFIPAATDVAKADIARSSTFTPTTPSGPFSYLRNLVGAAPHHSSFGPIYPYPLSATTSPLEKLAWERDASLWCWLGHSIYFEEKEKDRLWAGLGAASRSLKDLEKVDKQGWFDGARVGKCVAWGPRTPLQGSRPW